MWSEKDIEFLRVNAERMSIGEIAATLHKTKAAVASQAKRLRKTEDIPKIASNKLPICPNCLCPRTRVWADGTCRVCRAKETLQSTLERYHEALDAMDPNTRVNYISSRTFYSSEYVHDVRPDASLPPKQKWTKFEEDELKEISRVRGRIRKRIKSIKDFK